MRTKLYKFIPVVFIALFLIVGCTDEKYYESGARMERYTFDVFKNNWVWNDDTRRYEYFFDFEELDTKIYTLGAINVTVITNPTTDDKIQYPVPYPYVFGIEQPDGTLYTYTQYVSYDAVPGNIGFFLQSSDLGEDDFDLIDCRFKVTLFYDVEEF